MPENQPQGNIVLSPVLDAARVGIVEIACKPGRMAQERCPVLSRLSITYYHRMRDQDEHGGWLLDVPRRRAPSRLVIAFWSFFSMSCNNRNPTKRVAGST
jgi:hypothetical protein